MTDTPAPPRLSMFQQAVKEKLKARVAIDGPTGSGKTFTGLQAARILAGPTNPIGVFDTENRSAAYYAPTPKQLSGEEPMDRLNYWDPPYIFGHMPVVPPYSPILLAQWLTNGADEVGDDGCLLVDSLTHFWTGEGGTLDLVDDASARSGNSFTGWKEGTPAQRHLLDTIIHLRCHIVVTMRSKMEYIMETQVKNGKTSQVPRKVGMAPEQRAGIEYEFTVVGDMDLEHRLVISKSRCSLIADRVVTLGRSSEVWEAFAGWLDSGVERITHDQAQALVAAMNSVMDPDDRTTLKKSFVDVFGKPTELTTDRSADAVAWVRQRVARMNGMDEPAGTPEAEQESDTSPAVGAGVEGTPPPSTPQPDQPEPAAPEPDEPAPAADEPADVVSGTAADLGPTMGDGDGVQATLDAIDTQVAQAKAGRKARAS